MRCIIRTSVCKTPAFSGDMVTARCIEKVLRISYDPDLNDEDNHRAARDQLIQGLETYVGRKWVGAEFEGDWYWVSI